MVMLIELACVNLKSNEKKVGGKRGVFQWTKKNQQKKDLPVDVSKIGVK